MSATLLSSQTDKVINFVVVAMTTHTCLGVTRAQAHSLVTSPTASRTAFTLVSWTGRWSDTTQRPRPLVRCIAVIVHSAGVIMNTGPLV